MGSRAAASPDTSIHSPYAGPFERPRPRTPQLSRRARLEVEPAHRCLGFRGPRTTPQSDPAQAEARSSGLHARRGAALGAALQDGVEGGGSSEWSSACSQLHACSATFGRKSCKFGIRRTNNSKLVPSYFDRTLCACRLRPRQPRHTAHSKKIESALSVCRKARLSVNAEGPRCHADLRINSTAGKEAALNLT